jgi:CheY-like chemotaxis protein
LNREDLSELVRQHKTDSDIYHDLMQFRVREILLVATIYDAYILEEEDRLTETIFGEYHQLNLSTAPRITSVSFGEEALEILRYRRFDMVILTMRIDEISPFELARKIREQSSSLPILLLLNDNTEIRLVEGRKDRPGAFDKIFVWNGDSKIFLAMIKYIEDKLNADKDTRIGLVRVILLVEDSTRYYSRYLPILYSEIMRQTQRLISDEGLNDSKKLLRMRARPKVLMAENYEQAVELIDRYRECLLALISDVSFPQAGARDGEAGSHLIGYVRERVPGLPILLQSAEPSNAELAARLGASFLDKGSANLARELTEFVFNYLGFGDFVFRDASGRPIARAQTLERFKELLLSVPDDCLVYHAQRNHFSGWLMARGEIQIARKLQPVKVSDFPAVAQLREHLLEVYRQVQESRTRGRIIQFSESPPADTQHHVIRLAEGSLGGKGRGMAFLHLLLQNWGLQQQVPQMDIRIPKTWVIGTEEYEGFLERNGLAELFRREQDYARVRKRFLSGELSPALREKLQSFLQANPRPLSVRSSGMFEDSLSQPFSGIYETYLLGNNHPDLQDRQRQLEGAIKLVYASILSPSARSYFEAISYKVEEEKMAVLLQETVGRRDGNWFYPHISGVAQSYNYYPVAYLQPDDGIAVIGIGLGRYVIDGEKAFRFCPQYPRLDFLPPEEQVAGTQDSFYALDLGQQHPDLLAGDESTLARLSIQQAQGLPVMRQCLSIWDSQNGRLVLDPDVPGPRIANFAYILKYDSVPLARALNLVLDVVKSAMGTPVEIEFAVDLGDGGSERPQLHVLQIKPLLGNLEEYHLEMEDLDREGLLLYSERAMGNGRIGDLCDLIYVDPRRFERGCTVEMTAELDHLNARLVQEGRRCILIGPGRWGSKDRWLGIPVAWNNISAARVIVEAELADFKVDPSLGSHFFHNVTSMNIGYFDVPYGSSAGFIDWPWLEAQAPLERTAHLVHLRFARPLVVKMDGRKRVSAVFKP